jgi:hypothetical protein
MAKKRKPLPKPKKQPSLAALKKKLDRVFSIFIRKRDKGVCFTCDKKLPWKQQQNGHYISRGVLILRWDERNCNCQCVGCNIFKNGNMAEYAIRLMKKHGPAILVDLDREKWKILKMSRQDYVDLIDKYEKLI